MIDAEAIAEVTTRAKMRFATLKTEEQAGLVRKKWKAMASLDEGTAPHFDLL